jgi:hypothetical protein
VYHSPDWFVGAFIDVDERDKSARSILLTLPDSGEGTLAGEAPHLRRQHMRKCRLGVMTGVWQGEEKTICGS